MVLVCGCDGAEVRFHEDDDGDNHGDPAVSVVACSPPVGPGLGIDPSEDALGSPEAVYR